MPGKLLINWPYSADTRYQILAVRKRSFKQKCRKWIRLQLNWRRSYWWASLGTCLHADNRSNLALSVSYSWRTSEQNLEEHTARLLQRKFFLIWRLLNSGTGGANWSRLCSCKWREGQTHKRIKPIQNNIRWSPQESGSININNYCRLSRSSHLLYLWHWSNILPACCGVSLGTCRLLKSACMAKYWSPRAKSFLANTLLLLMIALNRLMKLRSRRLKMKKSGPRGLQDRTTNGPRKCSALIRNGQKNSKKRKQIGVDWPSTFTRRQGSHHYIPAWKNVLIWCRSEAWAVRCSTSKWAGSDGAFPWRKDEWNAQVTKLISVNLFLPQERRSIWVESNGFDDCAHG